MNKHLYPELEQFMAYFGQDHSLWGETTDEIVNVFKEECSAQTKKMTLQNIDFFLRNHPNDLESAFITHFGNDFSPGLWGHTAKSFLAEVTRLITE
jgi:hypothetical protein